MTNPLPLCDQSDLPRLLCSHCDGFTMTEAERAYLDGDVTIPVNAERHAHPVAMPEYQSRPWSEPRDVKVADGSVICSTPGCTRPSGDLFVCSYDMDDLEVALGNVPALLQDLEVMLTRQHRLPRRDVERKRVEHTRWDSVIATHDFEGNDQGKLLANRGYNRVPYVPKAGDVAAELGTAVASAVKALCEHRDLALPSVDTVGASRWLLVNLQAVALDPAGGDIVAEIRGAANKAMRTIDRPEDAERVYIGICANEKCQAAMYADPERPEHRCTTCGEVYEVQERLEGIRERLLESLMSLNEIVARSEQDQKMFGGKLTRKQLDGWVRRRRLVQAGTKREAGKRDEALYRAGDVLSVVGDRISA